MTKEQVIEQLKSLISGFDEVYKSVPICLEEAIKYLSEVDDERIKSRISK